MSKEDLKDDLIKFKHFTKMQELGYNEPAIPSYGEAFNWFRVKFNLQHSIEPEKSYNDKKTFIPFIYVDFSCEKALRNGTKSYRKSENWCIKQLIKFAKKA